MSPYSVVSKFLPLKRYNWGNDCKAWNLVDNKDLSIKLERMPPGTEEALHYHNHSQQFFYILKGTAVFEVDNIILIVLEEEGLHLEAGSQHRIMNKEEEKNSNLLFVLNLRLITTGKIWCSPNPEGRRERETPALKGEEREALT